MKPTTQATRTSRQQHLMARTASDVPLQAPVSVAWWGVMSLLQQIFIESSITRNAVIDVMSAARSS